MLGKMTSGRSESDPNLCRGIFGFVRRGCESHSNGLGVRVGPLEALCSRSRIMVNESMVFSQIKKIIKTRRFSLLDDDAYLKAYAQDSDRRISADYQKGIGGMWDEMGRLQFEFLKNQGLAPKHTLLDIGCGTLRPGRLIIPYLNRGHYTGFDVSRRAIEAAEELCRREGLLVYESRLLHVPDGRLNFSFLSDRFDYLLAQSVFTHLREAHIIECFSNIGRVMTDESRFFFTFYEMNENASLSYKSYGYAFGFFEKLARTAEFSLLRHPEYAHPRGQVMVEARR